MASAVTRELKTAQEFCRATEKKTSVAKVDGTLSFLRAFKFAVYCVFFTTYFRIQHVDCTPECVDSVPREFHRTHDFGCTRRGYGCPSMSGHWPLTVVPNRKGTAAPVHLSPDRASHRFSMTFYHRHPRRARQSARAFERYTAFELAECRQRCLPFEPLSRTRVVLESRYPRTSITI